MNALARLVAALALVSWSATTSAADDGPLLAEAGALSLPTYGLQAITAAHDGAARRVELAGLRIDGREQAEGIGIVRDGERTRIALETLLDVLGFGARRDGADARVDTPLGTARIRLGDCLSQAGGHFCAIDRLAADMALDIVFEAAEYSVRVRTAWPRDAVAAAAGSDVPADIAAPRASFSYARTSLDYRHGNGDDGFLGSGEFGGGLGDGYWRSAWFDDGTGRRGLYDYAWITQRGNTRALVGHQVMGLDPLLPSFDLLGAQGVWTNAPQAIFADTLGSRRLVSERVLPERALHGDGPPGGRAELRIDGVLVDSTVIPLSGRYVLDGPGPRNDPLAVVQVHLYERAFDSVPLRVEDRSFQTGDRLLADGAIVQFAGLGVQGNPLGDSTLRNRLDGHGAGFWQARYGIAPALTLEAAVQHSEEGGYAIGGAHVGLGGFGTLSALVGRNDNGDGALRVQTEGQRRQWFWRGYLQDEDAGYRYADANGERSLRYAETGWIGHRWMLSVIGRQEQDLATGRTLEFVKPALSVQPIDTLSLSVRPDSDGDYGWLARWTPTPRLYVNAYRDADRDQLEAQWSLPRDTRVVAGWVNEETLGQRHSLVGYRDRAGARNWHYGAGVLEADHAFGWLLEAGTELSAGSTLSAQALDDPLVRNSGGGGMTMWVNLTIDLVNTGSGFTRAAWRADYSSKGAVAGRLVLPPARTGESLAGVPVRIDGSVRATTDAQGRFHVGDLDAGVHEVALDDENLPLDFTPARRVVRVEVGAGRATSVRFALESRIGLAGRALGLDGKARAGVVVRLLDADGHELARQASDTWGFYRFSELLPGRYRLTTDGTPTPATRTVDLVDQHVFDQDLVVPP